MYKSKELNLNKEFCKINKLYFGNRLPIIPVIRYKKLYETKDGKISTKETKGSIVLAGRYSPKKCIIVAAWLPKLDQIQTLAHEMMHHDDWIRMGDTGHGKAFIKKEKRLNNAIAKDFFMELIKECDDIYDLSVNGINKTTSKSKIKKIKKYYNQIVEQTKLIMRLYKYGKMGKKLKKL